MPAHVLTTLPGSEEAARTAGSLPEPVVVILESWKLVEVPNCDFRLSEQCLFYWVPVATPARSSRLGAECAEDRVEKLMTVLSRYL